MRGLEFLDAPLDGGMVCLWLVLTALGGKIVEAKPRLRQVGKRIALGAFFLFVMLRASYWAPRNADEWVFLIVRSLLFAGIVLGTTWTVLPPLAFLYEHTFGELARGCRNWSQSARERIARRAEERERRRQQAAWERDQPHREREAREAAARAEAAAQSAAAAQRRRDAARAACELAYSLIAPEIGERFTKQELADYLARYMADALPPELVEERGVQLQAILRQHQVRIEPARQFHSFRELAAWLEARQAEIEVVPDERQRQALLAQLRERYSELAARLLAEMTA